MTFWIIVGVVLVVVLLLAWLVAKRDRGGRNVDRRARNTWTDDTRAYERNPRRRF